MISIDEFMARLRALDITLSVQGEELRCKAPKGTLTKDLTQELAARKADILCYLKQAELLAATGGNSIPHAPRDEPLPLSFGQQRLWFLDRLEGPSATYTMPLAVRLDGVLDTAALDRALHEIVRRHEVLRTNFVMQDRKPVVRICDTADRFAVRYVDEALRGDAAEPAEAIRQWTQAEATQCFDLAAETLLRATLVRLADTSHLLLLTMHHIVSDGWSLDLLIRELTTLYDAFTHGLPSPLPPLPLQYLDFAHWQRGQLQGALVARQLDFWRSQLAGIPDVLAIPTDRPRPAMQTYRGASLSSVLPADLGSGLRTLGQSVGSTLFMTLLGGFAILLSRYSGQQDIVVATPSANRPHPDLEGLIGLFINTLVIRLDLAGDPSVRAFMQQVRETCLHAYDHQDLPFEQLVEELKPARALSHSPVVQVAFDLRIPPQKIEMRGLTLAPIEQQAVAAKFDLSLSVEDAGAEVSTVWTYNPDLFDAATIAGMIALYQELLHAMVAQPEHHVGRLPLMDDRERQENLDSARGPPAPYRHEETFVTRFEACASEMPDRIAVSFGDAALTYRQLRQRVDQLACLLQLSGIGPDVRVAVFVERSLDMLIALLAVLKAGGAYVPLDPAYPRERLARVIMDSCPAVVLTQNHLRSALPANTAHVICLDSDWTSLAEAGARPVRGTAHADNIAYVIYTSGSTGRPKGVQVSHRSLLNLLCSMRREPAFHEHDVLLAVTTISFDIAGLELYLPLISGGRLVLAEREAALDARRLQAMISTHAANCMQATPATWRMLIDTGWRAPAGFTALCGGEALPAPTARSLVQMGVCLWNLYGPTETTIWSAVRQIEPISPSDAAPDVAEGIEPIGHAVDDTQLYVLDPHAELLPSGIPGELYIGGAGLARGYLNQPGMTAQGYVPDPFSQAAGARLYRTGDLVRRRTDGLIEFLGRIDHQVKIRGFRIELGEIEAALRQQPGIKEAVVVAREDGSRDKRLIGYLVASHDPPPDMNVVRAALREILPEYMVPAAFVALPAMPLTPNGKIDRRALPAPAPDRRELPANAPAPRSELENAIAAIWQQLLQVTQVGIDDNFFDIGGHSLLLTQVHEALRDRVTKPFPLVTLFQCPTIRTLAAWLAQEEGPRTTPVRTFRSRQDAGTQEIAIIGMAGRFPGADDLHTFWTNLREGRESIRFFSADELVAAGLDPELIARPNYVRANGCLSDVTGFDAAFFGLTPAEAEVMDPQHRLFLETAWHTLEHAGYAADGGKATIGVFAGCSYNGYLLHHLLPNLYRGKSLDVQQVILGSEKDFLATRVSYLLNLQGPSINVQTACSTSLVAVHMACRSLLDGECDMALAGAVGLKIPQTSGYTYHEGMIHSPDGHCRAFDADAQGTTWGSGVGVALLKRLDAARADRDTIHAVIKASAVNNDGSLKVSFTAPGLDAQAAVIASAQARAGVGADSISYIEAHGTGTRLGDPIEVAALTRAFSAGTDRRQFCALGSVKPNIGHLDTAAGMAGLFKTVLSLQHAQIPPTVHFRRGNPEIDFAASPFFVNDRLRDWPANGLPRRAGVSSFGLGGTNAHLVVEEAPARQASDSSRPWQLLIFSARSESALGAMRSDLSAHLRAHGELDLGDVAFTLAVGRRPLGYRSAVVCRDTADAAAALDANEHVLAGHLSRTQPDNGVVFMFPGQGSQFAGMGMELYRTQPVFRQHIDRCAELLQEELGLDLRRIMYPPVHEIETADAQMSQTWLTQPALFATEYALARLWMSWGMAPRAMIGHSSGEYVAACLAGVFDLETALRIVARRGRLMWQQPQGAMLAVSRAAEDVAPLLPDELSIAAVNTFADCVVSGPAPAIQALSARLDKEDIARRRLRTSHAFHSAMMDPIIASFTEILQQARLQPPVLPFVSNLTGTWILPEAAVDPHYWAQHLRKAVRFAAGMDCILQEPAWTPLEVGPGTTLTSFVRRHPLARTGRSVLPSFRRAETGSGQSAEETKSLLTSLGRLWTSGIEIDWSAHYAHDRAARVPLPCYPFERQRCWIDAPPHTAFLPPPDPDKKLPLDQWFHLAGWKPTLSLPAVGTQDLGDATQAWVVFSDGSALSRRAVAKLLQAGQQVITVVRGERYQRNARDFCIRPLVADDYAAVIDATDRRPACRILHFWSLSTASHSGQDQFESAQQDGYYSLLFLGRALANQQQCPASTIAVVTSHLHDVDGAGPACPEKATMLGPCLVMPQEAPQITCCCLDIGDPPEDEATLERVLDSILAESGAVPADPLVAYRGHRRLVPGFERVTLDPTARVARQLRPQGVYLITGGLGNVGLLLARFLAEKVRARLVLLGRSDFPPRAQWDAWLGNHADDNAFSRKIQQICAIETLGAEVLLIQADVADLQAMRTALAIAHDRFGELHGVIHAAGRLDDPSYTTMFSDVGEAESQAQFAPKVRGLYVLAEVLRGRILDFCLAISSNSAVLGGFGFAAYSAANAFVDAFAASQNRHSSTHWLSINWDTWLFDESATGPVLSMRPHEATEACFRVISCVTAGRVIVSTGDLQARFDRWVRREAGIAAAPATASPPQHNRPDLAASFAAPASEAEVTLASLWQELLGFTTIGIHDDFFELGGNSLLAIRLMNMIKEKFGRQCPLAVLLAKPTIHQLAAALNQSANAFSFSPLVAVQPKGELSPFFCVPGTGGNVLYLRELAQCLGEYGRPFYGFQASGLDGVTPPLTRIEDIAAQNIRALTERQATGPYFLGGHSFGSWVAFEMARQLQSAGHEVALVAVLDTAVPTARDLSAMGGWDDTRWVMTIADMMGRMYGKPHMLHYDQLVHLPWMAQIEALTRAMEAMGVLQPGTDVSEIRGFVEVYRIQAQIRYIPQPAPPIRLALFKAQEPLDDFVRGMPEALRNDATWGWQQYSRRPVAVDHVPGNHLSMISRPHVGHLAQRLQAMLVSEA